MTRESDIVHERGAYHVLRTRRAWVVLRHAGTHAVSVQDFAPDADGRSLAIAYCNYLAGARGKLTLDGARERA